MRYPPTRRGDAVEVHFGTPVADPYRWLEDADAPEVADWVARQRAFTESYLGGLPGRAWFTRTMLSIVGRPRAGIPHLDNGRWLLARNDGTRPQDVWYTADSLPELIASGRILVDPNLWSADGTASLGSLHVSPDSRLLAYTRSDSGSDWLHARVLDLVSGCTSTSRRSWASSSRPCGCRTAAAICIRPTTRRTTHGATPPPNWGRSG